MYSGLEDPRNEDDYNFRWQQQWLNRHPHQKEGEGRKIIITDE